MLFHPRWADRRCGKWKTLIFKDIIVYWQVEENVTLLGFSNINFSVKVELISIWTSNILRLEASRTFFTTVNKVSTLILVVGTA